MMNDEQPFSTQFPSFGPFALTFIDRFPFNLDHRLDGGLGRVELSEKQINSGEESRGHFEEIASETSHVRPNLPLFISLIHLARFSWLINLIFFFSSFQLKFY